MERKEFKSFYKTVGGNEGNLCYFPTRLDTYGCGCAFSCQYCYSMSLLNFRNLWDAKEPRVADINKIRRKLDKIIQTSDKDKPIVLRLGGMADCFQPIEKVERVTYETIKLLNERKIHYLIVTKSTLIADDEYMDIMDKKLAHIQVSITTTDDELGKTYEHAPVVSERIKAIEKLQAAGFDVTLRLSPFIPEFIDFDIINNVKCDKILIEFLRANPFIKKTFLKVDYNEYSLKDGSYHHMPLEKKLEHLSKIKNFKERSICEDVPEHYEYWKENYNCNKDNCCNIKL